MECQFWSNQFLRNASLGNVNLGNAYEIKQHQNSCD